MDRHVLPEFQERTLSIDSTVALKCCSRQASRSPGSDTLTGPAEYRNAELFVDLGVLALREPDAAGASLAAGPDGPDRIHCARRACFREGIARARHPVTRASRRQRAPWRVADLARFRSNAARRRPSPAGDPPRRRVPRRGRSTLLTPARGGRGHHPRPLAAGYRKRNTIGQLTTAPMEPNSPPPRPVSQPRSTLPRMSNSSVRRER